MPGPDNTKLGTSSVAYFLCRLRLAVAVLLAGAFCAAYGSAASATAAIAWELAETAPADSFETFLDRLIGAESGGQSNAKNPRSTALGTFQFTKSTFLEVARRHFPAKVAGFLEEKILTLRADREFARRAAAAFCRDNIGYLKAQGLEPTFADLRLAFLLGAGDAARVLKAEPETPAVKLLSPVVVKANPFMERMSAADLISKSVQDMGRDRTGQFARVPDHQAGPALRVRPPAKALTATIARRENCKLASCRKFTALQARKARAGRKA